MAGTCFPVSSGRCTTGIDLSMAQQDDSATLVVLDNEGLGSLEDERSSEFKTMLVMLSLAVSHVVFWNIKGEITDVDKNIVESALYASLQLRQLHDMKPKIVFVLRDMDDSDVTNQKISIDRILADFDALCKENGYERDSVVSIEQVRLLPTAIRSDSTVDVSRTFNPAFSEKVQVIKKEALGWDVGEKYGDLTDFVTKVEYMWGAIRADSKQHIFRSLDDKRLQDQVAESIEGICASFIHGDWNNNLEAKLSAMEPSTTDSDLQIWCAEMKRAVLFPMKSDFDKSMPGLPDDVRQSAHDKIGHCVDMKIAESIIHLREHRKAVKNTGMLQECREYAISQTERCFHMFEDPDDLFRHIETMWGNQYDQLHDCLSKAEMTLDTAIEMVQGVYSSYMHHHPSSRSLNPRLFEYEGTIPLLTQTDQDLKQLEQHFRPRYTRWVFHFIDIFRENPSGMLRSFHTSMMKSMKILVKSIPVMDSSTVMSHQFEQAVFGVIGSLIRELDCVHDQFGMACQDLVLNYTYDYAIHKKTISMIALHVVDQRQTMAQRQLDELKYCKETQLQEVRQLVRATTEDERKSQSLATAMADSLVGSVIKAGMASFKVACDRALQGKFDQCHPNFDQTEYEKLMGNGDVVSITDYVKNPVAYLTQLFDSQFNAIVEGQVDSARGNLYKQVERKGKEIIRLLENKDGVELALKALSIHFDLSDLKDTDSFSNRIMSQFEGALRDRCCRGFMPAINNSSLGQEFKDSLRKKVIGCTECCPFCNRKCAGGLDKHTHHVSEHQMMCFSGFRNLKSMHPSCETCQVPNQTVRAHGEKEYHSIETWLRIKYKDWCIDMAEEDEDDWITEHQRRAWKLAYKDLAAHYGYKAIAPTW